jgi:hypothetical protein
MKPDWLFEGQAFKKSHALRQCLSKFLLEKAAEENIGTCKNEKKREQDIVELIEHLL